MNNFFYAIINAQRVKAGFLHIETFGINRKLIHHLDLFTKDNKPKSYKYLRRT